MSSCEIGFDTALMERAAFEDFFLWVKSLKTALDSGSFSEWTGRWNSRGFA
jgi:hypothetical protein